MAGGFFFAGKQNRYAILLIKRVIVRIVRRESEEGERGFCASSKSRGGFVFYVNKGISMMSL